MDLKFEYLADRPNDIPQVITWWHCVWADRMGSDLEKATEQLRLSLSRDELPVHILAILNGKVVGVSAIKLQELAELFPDKQYWLGSVFVDQHHRGNKIGTDMTIKIVDLAKNMGLPHLYLQTINLSGGLYTKLGWAQLLQFKYKGEETLLMIKRL